MASGTYIIKFVKGTDAALVDGFYANELKDIPIKHKYNLNSFRGFAATLTDEQLQAVQKLPNFDYFEPDGVVTAYAQAQLDANKK